MLISSLITVKLFSKIDVIYQSFPDAFGFTLACVFLLYIAVLPLFIQFVLKKKFDLIDAQNSKVTTRDFKNYCAMLERQYDKVWDAFYEGLRKDSRLSMMYNYFFVVRRFFLATSLFYMWEYVAL